MSTAADAAHVPTRAFAAELIDLAIAGYLQIVSERRRDDGRRQHVYGVRLRRADWSASDPARTSLLRALFGEHAAAGAVVALDQYDIGLSRRLDARRAELAAQTGELGYRDDRYRWLRADRTPWWGYLIVAALVIAPLVHIFAVMIRDDIAWAPAGVDLLAMLAAIGALLLMVPRPIVTEKGVQLQADLDGIKVYLSSTGPDRLHALQRAGDASSVDTDDRSAVLTVDETLLPYALLFGLHSTWAAVLAQEYAATGRAPHWFGADFSPAALVSFNQAVSLSSLSGFYATGSIRGNLGGGGASGGAGGG
jgi:hypothetical protein